VNESQFVDWLELFGRSWKGNDPADIGALVPDKCAWHAGPFAEVFRDRQTLVDHWVSTVHSESNVEVEYEILSVTEEMGICRYRASYLQHKTARVECEYIFLITLDRDGKCEEFHEWGSSSTSPLSEYL
jgi:hypothetical protein